MIPCVPFETSLKTYQIPIPGGIGIIVFFWLSSIYYIVMSDRTEVLEEMALNLAQVLLNPNCKDQNERAQKRENAYTMIVKVIGSLAQQIAAAEDYADLLGEIHAVASAASATPATNPA